MKKILLIMIVSVFILTSCSVETSKFSDFDSDDITYVKDPETGLCFAVVASKKSTSVSQSGLGMACVPCSEKVLEKIKEN